MNRLSTLVVATAAMAFCLPAMALTPAAFQGKPNFAAEQGAGAFVWHDSDGLHVRLSTKGKPRRLHGKVCTPNQAFQMTPVRTDYGDRVRIGPKGHCVHFDFLTANGIDGFDFRAAGTIVEFDFNVGDRQMSTANIHIGSNNAHPANSPFVLDRPNDRPKPNNPKPRR